MGNISFQHRKRPIFDEVSRRRLLDRNINRFSPMQRSSMVRSQYSRDYQPLRRRTNQLQVGKSFVPPNTAGKYSLDYSPTAVRRPLTPDAVSRLRQSSNRGYKMTPTRQVIWRESDRLLSPSPPQARSGTTVHQTYGLRRSDIPVQNRLIPNRHILSSGQHVYMQNKAPTYQQTLDAEQQRMNLTARRHTPHKYELIDVTDRLLNQNQEHPDRNEIIRKIRNFNDFINAVKKELNDKRDRQKSVRIKMDLQNQAFDIDKYRNLFENEVAKKYGISSINISQSKDEPIKYLDLSMGKATEYDHSKSKEKEDGTTNRRTSVGSVLKGSILGKESIIAKGKEQLEQRLRQTMKQLKDISELLYNETQPSKSRQITTNINNIASILNGEQADRTEQLLKSQQHILQANKCFKRLQILSATQQQYIQTTRGYLQHLEATEQDSES